MTWEHNSQFGYFTKELSNGLKVVLLQSSVQPSVQVQIVYHFGSNAEKGNRERGLAHICEHMIFKGTLPDSKLFLSETDIPAIARLLGASYNAFTSTNKTSYHFQSCPEYVEGFLEIIAASMFDCRLDEQHLRSEKLAVLQEMANGKDELIRDAIIKVRQKMYNAEFGQYWPTIGNIADISDLTADVLRNFYESLYKPSNATLFVVGDMTDEHLQELKSETIEKLFVRDSIEESPLIGATSSRQLIPPVPEINHQINPMNNCFHTLSSKEAMIMMTFPLRGLKSNSDTHSAMKALSSILFDGETSRLYNSLVISPPKSLGVESVGGFFVLDNNFSEYHIIISGSPAMKEGENEETIKANVLNAFKLSPTTKELQKCRQTLEYSIKAERTSLSDMTNAWIDNFHLTRDLDTYWRQVIIDDWETELKERMEEISSARHWAMSYTACSKAMSSALKTKMQSESTIYKTKLTDEHHKRDTNKYPLEKTNSLELFANEYKNTVCPFPKPPDLSYNGNWTILNNPKFQLYRAVVRPRQHLEISQSLASYYMKLVSEVMNEAFAKEKDIMKEKGIHGSASHHSVYVTTHTPHAFAEIEQFIELFASQIDYNADSYTKITEHFTEPVQKRIVEEWKNSAISSRMSPEGQVHEWCSKFCSDNHYLSEDGEDFTSFDEFDKIVAEFESNPVEFLKKGIDIWNSYWGDTDQVLVTSNSSPIQLERPEISAIASKSPKVVAQHEKKMKKVVVNPDVPLNQSIVGIARKATLAKSSTKFWTIRMLAETIMFHSLGSRLYKLREQKGLFYNAFGSFSQGATQFHTGMDVIGARVEPGAEQSTLRELQNFVRREFKKPVKEEELVAAKRLAVNYWRGLNCESDVMSHWSRHSHIFTNFTDTPKSMIKNIESLTKEDVNEFLYQESVRPYYFSVICN